MDPSRNEIAVFGGAFDPLHDGHRHIIRWLADHRWRVWIVPTMHPRHKPAGHQAGFGERASALHDYATGLAAEIRARIRILDTERQYPDIAGRSGVLIEVLDKTEGPHHWHLVVGADEWCSLDQWVQIDQWFTRVSWIVFPRTSPWIGTAPPMPACAQRIDYRNHTDSECTTLRSSEHALIFVHAPLVNECSTNLRHP